MSKSKYEREVFKVRRMSNHSFFFVVIGRKVNMAARLMMHYPNKVTCGERTFQQSRLPSINFRVLGAKRMKGLQNVGVIREYVESSETSTQSVAKIPYFQFPILGEESLTRQCSCIANDIYILMIFCNVSDFFPSYFSYQIL